MNYSKSSHALKKKGSSDSETLGFDLLYQLSYMSAISAAGISRSQIFALAAKLPCCVSSYMDEIVLLATKMRYDYAVACRMVGESAKQEAVKSLLLRLANSLSSGESEANFLAQEANIQAEAFKNYYERGIESLRKWSEAYAAMVVSAALIVMVAAVSMLIYPMGTGFVLTLTILTIATSIAGTWMVYRVAPKEIKIHAGNKYCASVLKLRRFERIMVGLAVITLITCQVFGLELGWTLVIISAIILPIGIRSIIFERSVNKKDQDISTFLRSLGNVATAIGVTVTQAVTRLDLRSTAALSPDVKVLRSRLSSRLNPDLCWQRFSMETGSEVVYRSIRMFHDATRLGGEPEEVGARSSLLAMSLDFLRAKRGQVANSFAILAMGIHAAIVGLLVFITQVVLSFARVVEDVYTEALASSSSEAMSSFSFNFGNVYILEVICLPCLLILAATTAFASNAATGGSRYRLYLYLAFTFGMSGTALITVPMLTDMIFASVSIT